jgi:outer membrane lipoprotein-sorting protein
MTGLRFTLTVALLCAGTGLRAASLDQVLKRMDQNALTFKSMTAKVRWVSYIAVIKEENASTGTLRMKRSKRDVRVVVEFTSPDPKSVAVAGAKVELYYPKMKTVEEHNLGGHDVVEKYLALGFGASGNELKADYAIREMGVETVNGEQATRLELIPKSKEVLQQFPKIELWISDATGYPVQEKFYQTGGDYTLINYSEVTINPSLPDSAFKLNLPKGVQRVSPGKSGK